MGVFDAVFASSVRQAVLRELREEPRQRRDLLDDVDASTSAVYDALNELRDRDLVREGRTRRWETTGLGDLVADYVDGRDRASDVLSTHADYWTTYDPSGLPDAFRRSLGALAGCECFETTDAEPFRAFGEAEGVVESADAVSVVAPVYRDRDAAALERAAETADVRLLLAADVLDDADGREDVEGRENADGCEDAAWDADDPTVRVGDPEFSLVVTDETMLLALPRADGSYDVEGTLRADAERALDWGERLFEYAWRESVPLERLTASSGEDVAESSGEDVAVGDAPAPGQRR